MARVVVRPLHIPNVMYYNNIIKCSSVEFVCGRRCQLPDDATRMHLPIHRPTDETIRRTQGIITFRRRLSLVKCRPNHRRMKSVAIIKSIGPTTTISTMDHNKVHEIYCWSEKYMAGTQLKSWYAICSGHPAMWWDTFAVCTGKMAMPRTSRWRWKPHITRVSAGPHIRRRLNWIRR